MSNSQSPTTPIRIDLHLTLDIPDKIINTIVDGIAERIGKPDQTQSTPSVHKQPAPFAELPEVLTTQQVAQYLNLSRRRIYEFIQLQPENGGLPSFKLGAGPKAPRRVYKSDLLQWLEAQKRE